MAHPNLSPRGSGSAITNGLDDILDTLRALEAGSRLTRFYMRKRPEIRMFSVKLETRQIVWSRNNGGKPEGIVDIREIREIRPGKNSKEFERMKEDADARRYSSELCFVVFYGSDFCLKALSLAAPNQMEYKRWLDGLTFLVEEQKTASYTLQVERWLRKEFYGLDSHSNNRVTMRDIKSWLPRINYKMSTNSVRERFQLLEKYFLDLLKKNQGKMSLDCFQFFLVLVQKETKAKDKKWVECHMSSFLEDPHREAIGVFFTKEEFLSYLFSAHNSIWDDSHSVVSQNMDLSLNNYWIASSHNTYLTGDQFLSDSSTEAYARCLRWGCRCIELDCWDGPENKPIITHGHTMTSKISFTEALTIIRDSAFVVSDYPLILSIENHCSIPQQRAMASAFKSVFGDALVTEYLECSSDVLPSPNQLKRRIIIKHKKLPDNAGTGDVLLNDDSNQTESDLSNSIKNGMLFLEDPVERKWLPHFFVLTSTKLSYTEETQPEEEEDEEPALINAINEELHYSEKWFHGRLEGGRDRAEMLLHEYSYLGDGTFLVRDSETFVGDFSLSFWRRGQVHHCRIKSRQEGGQIKYFLIPTYLSDSLYSLIQHYREYPLRAQSFDQVLTEPVPQPQSHIGKQWYHDNIDRETAEDWLSRVHYDGAFLIRRRQQSDLHDSSDPYQFAISFRAEGKIKHCRIKQEERLYTIGTASFESLVELVDYYKKNPLYRKMKLRYAVNEEVVQRQGMDPDEQSIYSGEMYTNPNDFVSRVKVRALYDYKKQRADELSFTKNAVIINVQKQDGGWWRGDYAGDKQLWFPANHVEEIESEESIDDSHDDLLGALQKGSFDIRNVVVDRLSRADHPYIFRVTNTKQMKLEIACADEHDMLDWIDKIRMCANNAQQMQRLCKNMERTKGIARELSDLSIYCRPVPFDKADPKNIYEMCSFPETKVEGFVKKRQCGVLIEFNRRKLSRVYPKGQRVESSNYDPMQMWNCNIHMTALNYQTPDRAIQLNDGLFQQNGHCGYVLQPESVRKANYDPYDKQSVDVQPICVSLTIIGARHLVKSGRGIASPFVEVEVTGAYYDRHNKYKTGSKVDNGFNPLWFEQCEFDVINPEVALIRFVVQDEDMFSEANFLGQATYPVRCLRPGFRSIQLKNGFGEDLELATLLVLIDLKNPMEEDGEMYVSIQQLRDRSDELRHEIEALEQQRDSDSLLRKRQELRLTETSLLEKSEERIKSR
ncbi:hypothetical protein LSH36_101g04011 [Paralvinella palmiformis]|uniref:Phosphoinositide phospholipase C n=1 Tax=Paralvinella palmiformis TaxID=53620 RepID=A0AAD9K030_9ANNE|nr:hypothetical protein LSH36_101g04011 [Paralvinella palmiformis]